MTIQQELAGLRHEPKDQLKYLNTLFSHQQITMAEILAHEKYGYQLHRDTLNGFAVTQTRSIQANKPSHEEILSLYRMAADQGSLAATYNHADYLLKFFKQRRKSALASFSRLYRHIQHFPSVAARIAYYAGVCHYESGKESNALECFMKVLECEHPSAKHFHDKTREYIDRLRASAISQLNDVLTASRQEQGKEHLSSPVNYGVSGA